MKVVFLDIDGVLNSQNYMTQQYVMGILPDDKIDPDAVVRLNQITDATGAVIVVSSTWRLHYLWRKNSEGLKVLLKEEGITGTILDVTPDHQKYRGRGGEIQEWMDLCGQPIESFVILDDSDDMDHLIVRLIRTNFMDGLQDVHVQKAILMLGKK
jgi:hypothetical protein